jgi:RNA 3'-terminal phosphate cyclase (ATP)
VVPLSLTQGASILVVRGGTHQDWAPAYDDFTNAYLPALRRMGFSATAKLTAWGWYPAGGGEVVCTLEGGPGSVHSRASWPRPIEALVRGPLIRIVGRAVAANLPAHIAQRMSDRARAILSEFGVPVQIEPLRVWAVCPGAGIYLLAEYDTFAASFSAHGRQGKPSEAVADEAVAAFRQHHSSGAAVELHLADQLLLPLAISAGPSAFTMARPTAHLATNAWTIEQFGLAKITVEQGLLTRVQVLPLPANAS